MALTSYGDQKALEAVFNGGTVVYFGLSTSHLAIDGSGYTEPAGGSYARVAVTGNSANFPVSIIPTGNGGGAEVKNANAITWPQSTASWGTVVSWFAADSATIGSGNVVAYGDLSSSQNIGTNTTVSFSGNALTLSDV